MKGMSSSKKRSEQKHVTVSPISGDKIAFDSVNKNFYKQGVTRTVEAGSTSDIIKLTAHGAFVGDIIRFKSGSSLGIEASILKIIDANSFELGSNLPSNPLITDTFDLMRALSGTVDSSGNLIVASAPVKYVLNGIDTVVGIDTVTPSNNTPLPVEIASTTGTVTINAGNINVQTSHLGATFDSQRIGDGTNVLGINASLEALTHDLSAITALGSLLTELQLKANLLDTQPVSAASLPLPSGASTELTLSALNTAVGLLAKLTDTQPVSAASLPLPTGAASQTTLAALLSELQLKANLLDTQPVSAASLPLPSGASTELTLAAILTELALKSNLTDTQPVSAASLPLPTGAASEATLASQSAKLPASLGQKASAASMSVVLSSDSKATALDIVDRSDVDLIDTSVTNIPTATFLQVVANTASACKKIQILEDIGEYMGLYVGAAASEVLKTVLPLGGGTVELAIPAGSRVSLKSLTGANIIAGKISINLLG